MAQPILTPNTVPFGVTADESALLIQSFSRKFASAKKEVMSFDGEYAVIAVYNLKAEISFEGITDGTPSFTVGTAPTIAGETEGYGCASGILVLTQAELSLSNEDLRKFSANATRYGA